MQRPQLATQSLPVPSDIWRTASIASLDSLLPRRSEFSSMQSSSIMASSMSASTTLASTLMSPGIRSLFDTGTAIGNRSSGSKASAVLSAPIMHPTAAKRAVLPHRVSFLRNGGYETSEQSSLWINSMPGEDNSVHDVTAALGRV